MRAYRAELAIDSNNYDANFQLGVLLKEDRLTAEALPYFQRAARLRPDGVAAPYQISMIDLAEDRVDKARLALERIVRQAPKFAQRTPDCRRLRAARAPRRCPPRARPRRRFGRGRTVTVGRARRPHPPPRRLTRSAQQPWIWSSAQRTLSRRHPRVAPHARADGRRLSRARATVSRLEHLSRHRRGRGSRAGPFLVSTSLHFSAAESGAGAATSLV